MNTQYGTPIDVEASGVPFDSSPVILPGAVALLCLQFLVTLSKAFFALDRGVQMLQFAALAANAAGVVILLVPSIMRDYRGPLLRLASAVAPAPLALAIAFECYVAGVVVLENRDIAILCGRASLIVLLWLWYGLPLALALRARFR